MIEEPYGNMPATGQDREIAGAAIDFPLRTRKSLRRKSSHGSIRPAHPQLSSLCFPSLPPSLDRSPVSRRIEAVSTSCFCQDGVMTFETQLALAEKENIYFPKSQGLISWVKGQRGLMIYPVELAACSGICWRSCRCVHTNA